MTETVQENATGVLTSAVPEAEALNAEAVTTMSTDFLKRIGHKAGVKPKRVSQEGDLYTVELEMKKFTVTVKVDALSRQIKEYDVQPKSEESSLSSLAPKTLIIMVVVSGITSVGLYFALNLIGM